MVTVFWHVRYTRGARKSCAQRVDKSRNMAVVRSSTERARAAQEQMAETERANATLRAGIAAAIPRLRRYATALIGDVSEADDLVQDCVERALSRIETLRDPERLTPWLLSILHNLHVSAVRARQRRGIAVAVDGLADDLALSVPAEDRPAVRDFVRCMAALSPEHRQVLLLVSLEGLSYREVTEVLDIPIGTVMSRLARARERLRVLLEGGEDRVVRESSERPRQ